MVEILKKTKNYPNSYVRQLSLVGDRSHLEDHIQQHSKGQMLQFGRIMLDKMHMAAHGLKRHSLQVLMAVLILVR